MGTDEWLDLLAGRAAAGSDAPLVRDAAGLLQARMDADSRTEERIVAILDRCLVGRARDLTLANLQTALATYLGDEVSYLLVWLSEPNAMAQRLADFSAVASPAVDALVRALVARYAQELRDAQEAAGQPADEWRNLAQEAFLDQLTDKYTIRVRIEKYSGEAIVLEASPNSALALVKFMNRALATMTTPGTFDATNLADYFDEVDEFRARIAAAAGDGDDVAAVTANEPAAAPIA